MQELCFTVWLGVHGAILAAAADPRVACLRDGQGVTVRSTNGVLLPLLVDSILSEPGPSGCVYAAVPASAACSAAGSQVVLKVAPPPLLARQADALGLPRMAWAQVRARADSQPYLCLRSDGTQASRLLQL